jgi:hypothetical protein
LTAGGVTLVAGQQSIVAAATGDAITMRDLVSGRRRGQR